jgi:aryl-alcohol dehydrogenase-like predicted oxidoreductase
MELRILGPSGLRVSRLCLGVATFGNADWGSDEAESRAILDRFLEAGGNFVDAANRYADGHSEEILGELLAGRRDAIVVGTKYSARWERDVNSGGSHRKSLVRSLEASLRRLRTDYVDVLWVHAWDSVTPIDEVVRALDDQVRFGKVLNAGVSNSPAWMAAHANAQATLLGRSPFVALQNEYNLLERGVERELLPMTRYFGLAFMAWAPLAQGRLTGKYAADSAEPKRLNNEELAMTATRDRIVATTVEVANELGWQPATVALTWLVQHAPDVIPVVGARTLYQLEANLKCLELELPAEAMARLEEASAIDPGNPRGFLTSNDSGRDFMWGEPLTVPPAQARSGAPWWEL